MTITLKGTKAATTKIEVQENIETEAGDVEVEPVADYVNNDV